MLSTSLSLLAGAVFLLAFWLYRLALPKPLPGIPYNHAAAKSLLGDVAGIKSHMANVQGGTFITYIMQTMKELDAPLIQVFIQPFQKPLVVMSDFPEAHDMLVRRKDFDRSHTLGDLVWGLAPDHHIHLKTDAAWKGRRRLVQDLMTPSFLHNVASPALHAAVGSMVELWRAKSAAAAGRPWAAADDVNLMALDAVLAFAFGEGFGHSATLPALEAVRAKGALGAAVPASSDVPVEFPKAAVDAAIQATLDLTETVGEVQGNPFPRLTWSFVTRRPKVKRAIRIKEDYIKKELHNGVKRLQDVSGGAIQSAVDQMIVREQSLAEKEGRAPDFYSRGMIDEVFGFIFAGHETTSTTLCWALKFLADTPAAQTELREALRAALPVAAARGGSPTHQEITSAHVPYLDATMEETLRCAGTAPVVDRVAVADTELLGRRIPRGTVVTCLVTGPGMTSPGFAVDAAARSPTSRAALDKDGAARAAWDPATIGRFDPRRWLVRRDDGGAAGRDEFDAAAGPQLAFGLGTRGCYGKRLVYLEMRIVLALVLWNFELLPCPPALSGYHASLVTTNEPQQCFVRLRAL